MATPLDLGAQVTVAAGPARVRAAAGWQGQHRWILSARAEGGRGLGARVTGSTGIGPPPVQPLARWGLALSLRRFARLLVPS
jgi:hypothetical protein